MTRRGFLAVVLLPGVCRIRLGRRHVLDERLEPFFRHSAMLGRPLLLRGAECTEPSRLLGVVELERGILPWDRIKRGCDYFTALRAPTRTARQLFEISDAPCSVVSSTPDLLVVGNPARSADVIETLLLWRDPQLEDLRKIALPV